MKRGTYRQLLLVFILGLCACSPVTEPSERTPIDAPAWLPEAFSALEACVGRRPAVSINEMRFFEVAQQFADEKTGDRIHPARSFHGTNHIYFTDVAVQFPRVWMHEMAHLMYHAGDDHPPPIFDKCDLMNDLYEPRQLSWMPQ
ncbi:MAG TPA: hypothetical protein VE967_00630 [Gemmatimonadaceae bacterium]|nr:hypothetical protein [Gemmatimonadaceae bacterium]